ncbi:hypothetical protein [Sphingomonas sp.]
MTHDPDRDDEPSADIIDTPQVPPASPETENIEDEGEPLGANLA